MLKSLDPSDPLQKKQIKALIVDSIAREIADVDRDEIARDVEIEYERLLVGAIVFSHIPSLTNGSVRRHIRSHHHARAVPTSAAA